MEFRRINKRQITPSSKKGQSNGFTLIEILIVILIVSFLLVPVAISFSRMATNEVDYQAQRLKFYLEEVRDEVRITGLPFGLLWTETKLIPLVLAEGFWLEVKNLDSFKLSEKVEYKFYINGKLEDFQNEIDFFAVEQKRQRIQKKQGDFFDQNAFEVYEENEIIYPTFILYPNLGVVPPTLIEVKLESNLRQLEFDRALELHLYET